MTDVTQQDIADEFRALIRAASAETGQTVEAFVQSLFDDVVSSEGEEGGSKKITYAQFEKGIHMIKSIRKGIKRGDLEEIFEECDEEGHSNITINELVDFCQRSVSRARAMALKLRKAIIESLNGSEQFEKAYYSIAGNAKFADVDLFRDFAEDMLNIHINDSDSLALYSLYDTNGDGKVSLDDFMGFIHSHTPDAAKALDSLNPENIVDIRLSSSRAQEADLVRQGYTQVSPDISGYGLQHAGKRSGPSADVMAAEGTFGRGHSMWVWRAKQGTCCGKLRPIVDIQLEHAAMSTAMVVSGYTCVSVPVAGKWLWIKRAQTVADEQDSIVDIQVTSGHEKNPADKIWSNPGAGWIRVDGNFCDKGFLGMFGSTDSFVWILPAKERTMSSHLASPVRAHVYLHDEERHFRLMETVKTTLRHHVALDDMKTSSDPYGIRKNKTPEETKADHDLYIAKHSTIDLGCTPLFHKYATGRRTAVLSASRFRAMMIDVGLKLDKADYKYIFHYFDFKQDFTITREEFAFFISLTDCELDHIVDTMKARLWEVTRGASRIKHNRMLRDIYRIINTDGVSILSIQEVMVLCARFNVFLTEDEARKLMRLMDCDGNDKVEEKDFLLFMKSNRTAAHRSAQRVKEATSIIRRWMLRGNNGETNVSSTGLDSLLWGNSASGFWWKELESKHQNCYGTRFPGYLTSVDFSLIACNLGINLSAIELKQIVMAIAPLNTGRVRQSDLQDFMSRRAQSFGELLHILETDLLKVVVDVYKNMKKEKENSPAGTESPVYQNLADEYREIVNEVVRSVQETPKKVTHAVVDQNDILDSEDPNDPHVVARRKAKHFVVAVQQVKDGIEHVLRGYETPVHLLPNLEEWVFLGILTEAVATEYDHYGINIKKLIEGLCEYIVDDNGKGLDGEEITLDMLCRDLQRMIIDEARASSATKGKVLDYHAPFSLFDEDGSGHITPKEFQSMLVRLQLIDLLPEGKLPAILAKFDPKNKGYITADDFKAFVESMGYVPAAEDFEDDSDYESDYGLTSNTPPVTVTRTAELDWLSWFLYREACKVDPEDPESVITELGAACAESEIIENEGSITKMELWTLLYELKLKGNMTKQQYDDAIKHLAFDRNEEVKGDDLVDYESLCRYVVRMGRAFNAMVQEKRKESANMYQNLKKALLAEIRGMVSVGSKGRHGDEVANAKSGTDHLRFEKVFRRLDSDGDGKVTVREFKAGLRRLRCRDEKRWTLRMIRKLFDDFDKNGDGLLSMKEFSVLVYAGEAGEDAPAVTLDSDEEDIDDGIFRKEKQIYDAELFRKVVATLLEVVPAGEGGVNHIEAVKAAVRKFFQRSDPDQKGVVSEERFRAFCRRSSLQEALSASEVRALIERLRKRRAGRSSRVGNHGGVVIDYERFLHQISKVSDSIPHSHAEAALAKIQDAAAESAAAGRPFISLCSLVDQAYSGTMTQDELIHTFKMMGALVSHEEVRALQELLPPTAVTKDGLFYYREVFWLIQHHTPAPLPGRRADLTHTFDFAPRALSSPHTPFYVDTPAKSIGGDTPRWAPETVKRQHSYDNTRRVSSGTYDSAHLRTPLGDTVTTPYRPDTTYLDRTERDNPYYSSTVGAFDRMIKSIASRTKMAVEEKSRKWAAPFSLRKQFEVFDTALSGFVTMRTFQGTLDDIGVILTAPDIHAVQKMYGRPEDDMVDYGLFCGDVLGDTISSRRGYPSGGDTFRYHHMQSPASDNMVDIFPPATRLTETLRQLRNTGQDPRDIFEAYDLDRTGEVDASKFQEVVNRLKLLQTAHQLDDAIQKYQSISNRYRVCYDDFCTAMERHAASEGSSGYYPRLRDSLRYSGRLDDLRHSARLQDHSTTDSPLASDNIEKWYSQDATPREQRDFDRVYGSLDRFKTTMDPDSSGHHRHNTSFHPPRPSDSVTRLRLDKTSTGRHSWDRGGIASLGYSDTPRDNLDSSRRHDRLSHDSPRHSQGSPGRNRYSHDHLGGSLEGTFHAPRSPPAKVGSVMWGSDTPLRSKGHEIQLDDSCWVCSVCYFTENPIKAKACEICQSPNYNVQKDFQIKQQCTNCTFLNGHFAKECEMCGEKMGRR